MTLETRDPHFERRVRDSFERQQFMALLGASLARVGAGEVDIDLPFSDQLTQQHGFLHAGALASALDSACGYAASTLMDESAAVLTVEFKVNLLEPAVGDRFVARGRVVRAGRTGHRLPCGGRRARGRPRSVGGDHDGDDHERQRTRDLRVAPRDHRERDSS